jgi:hypothetical protein
MKSINRKQVWEDWVGRPLSDDEFKQLEAELTTDPIKKAAFEEELTFSQTLHDAGLRQRMREQVRINATQKQPKPKRVILWLVLFCGALLIGFATYFGLNLSNHKEVVQPIQKTEHFQTTPVIEVPNKLQPNEYQPVELEQPKRLNKTSKPIASVHRVEDGDKKPRFRSAAADDKSLTADTAALILRWVTDFVPAPDSIAWLLAKQSVGTNCTKNAVTTLEQFALARCFLLNDKPSDAEQTLFAMLSTKENINRSDIEWLLLLTFAIDGNKGGVIRALDGLTPETENRFKDQLALVRKFF